MKPTTNPLPFPLLLLLFSTLPTTITAWDNCIRLTGDKSYTWKADGSFTGSGFIDDEPHCFPSGSGGISIGHPDAPAAGLPGNTRIEFYFPTSGGETDTNFYNCNLSLVDGFSAAVTCAVAGGGWPNSNNVSQPIGCGYDLLSECPDEAYDAESRTCKNRNGAHAESEDGVDEVFRYCRDSEEFPNSAEIWYNMPGAFKFSKTDFTIVCEVGKGIPVGGGKVKREAKGQAGVEEKEKRHARAHAHQHGSGQAMSHIHRLKARDLTELVTS